MILSTSAATSRVAATGWRRFHGPVWLVGLVAASTTCMAQPLLPVINEIHFDPEHEALATEFIEVHNPTASAMDLSGWSLADAVDFVFPPATVVASGGHVVVGENPAALAALYGAHALGPFQKQLANEGERVTLRSASGSIVDEVDYLPGFPWPSASAGEGSSMELVNPALDNSLGGSWRSSRGAPTPGRKNSAFSTVLPPHVHEASHSPQQPASGSPIILTAKVTDADGVKAVEALYQMVAPGEYIPSHLPLPYDQLLAAPNTPLPPNPEFEDAANWTRISMKDDGAFADALAGDGIYTAVLPGQPNRTLVRYRIEASDSQGASVRVPYPDDPTLNFACFVYDGVPAWKPDEATCHQEGLGHVYARAVMRSLPVYFLITRKDDMRALLDPIPIGNLDARSKFNWEGAFVYDGIVYDHIHYRLRHATSRYLPGKNSLRFEFNRGHFLQVKDDRGQPYPVPWRRLNLSRMFDTRGVYNFGLVESVNSVLWNLVGVPAPFTHWLQLRVVAQPLEAPPPPGGQYAGDFWGVFLALEDFDPRFIDAHEMADGNLYKLKDQVFDPIELIRNQGKHSVTNGEDFILIHEQLRPGKSAEWLRTYVNWDKWYRYGVIQETIRHDDYHPADTHLKNRAWYFEPVQGNPLGRLWVLPWDTDSTWGPNWGGTGGYARYAIFGDPEKSQFRIEYRNQAREFRDLIWQKEVLNPMIDRLAARIEEITRADQDRWHIPNHDSLAIKVQDMKNFAFVGWSGGNSGEPVGPGGRAAYLDEMTGQEGDSDSIPLQPQILFAGPSGFPMDSLIFESGPFQDPQGNDTFKSMEWRLAEVTDPAAPAYDPQAPPFFEWNIAWTSILNRFKNRMTVPPEYVQAGHAYRVRLRWCDTSGRWSHWSAPIQFIATLPGTSQHARDQLRISEVMYHPAGGAYEFLELENAGPAAVDLRTVRIGGGITFDFGFGAVSSLGPGERVVIVEDAAAFRSRYPAQGLNIAGEYSGQLSNGGERITLHDKWAGTILDFEYRDDWHSQTDGDGFSLVAEAMAGDPELWNDPRHWRSSEVLGGSPGRPEPNRLPKPGTVVINEVMPPQASADDGWIELANLDSAPADLADWYLSDDPAAPWKYRLPEQSQLPPGGFLVLKADETFAKPGVQSAFRLSATGGGVYLFSTIDGAPGGYRTQALYGAAVAGQSWGRHPSGGDAAVFVPLQSSTLNAANSEPVIGPVVISEIFLDSRETKAAEFIELYNASDREVELAPESPNSPPFACRLTGQVEFAFAPGAVIPARQFLVVAGGDPRYVRERFRVPAAVPVTGPFERRLTSADGEIVLVAGGFDSTTGLYRTDLEERVQFPPRASLEAPRSAGTSLGRIQMTGYGSDPGNWAPSSPSPGRFNGVDDDYDGIPDGWETFYGGNPADSGDLIDDLDGDSQTLWQEYVAGTDPRDASDYLCLHVSHTGTRWRILLPTRKAAGPGYEGMVRRYQIQSRSLASWGWVPATDWFVGDGQTSVVEDAFPDGHQALIFRAVVELAPQTAPQQ